MTNKFDQLMSEYLDKLGEVFPARMVSDPDQAMEIMEECIKTGKPYDPYGEEGFDPNADY